MENFETVQVETDLLILGGGMASCGAAVEAAYWAKKNGLKVTMVDKAAVDRSGAVAMDQKHRRLRHRPGPGGAGAVHRARLSGHRRVDEVGRGTWKTSKPFRSKPIF